MPGRAAIVRDATPPLNIRVGADFGARAGVRDGPVLGITDGLRIAPEAPGLMVVAARRPGAAAFGQLGLAQRHVEGAGHGVDRDHVAVVDEPDRTAGRRLRPDMANAEAVRRTGKPSVGQQRDRLADALAVERCGRRQHLTHAGPAARALIANDDDVAFFVPALLDSLERVLLAVEAQ